MGVRGHEWAHVHTGVIARANVIVSVLVSEGGCESECTHAQESTKWCENKCNHEVWTGVKRLLLCAEVWTIVCDAIRVRMFTVCVSRKDECEGKGGCEHERLYVQE